MLFHASNSVVLFEMVIVPVTEFKLLFRLLAEKLPLVDVPLLLFPLLSFQKPTDSLFWGIPLAPRDEPLSRVFSSCASSHNLSDVYRVGSGGR